MTTVLVIDDEFAVTEILSGLLEDAGYRVVTAGNGRTGLARLAEARPDLVFCDVMMPLLDGRAVLQAMQADPAYRAIPVVLMTAAPAILAQAGTAPAALLVKPFDLDSVLDLAARLTGGPDSRPPTAPRKPHG